jgi:hypothetical protein
MAGLGSEYGVINIIATPHKTPTGQAILTGDLMQLPNWDSNLD